MSTLLIGHRGTGKTSFLARAQAYGEGAIVALDLDREVEALARAPVDRLFAERGEPAFRELERQALAAIAERARSDGRDYWVAAGAGFEGAVPSGWRALWLARASDGQGRVFLDRPRLDEALSPIGEYFARKAARDERYAQMANERLEVDEGFDQPTPEEKALVLGTLRDAGGAVTILPPRPGAALAAFARKAAERAEQGAQWLELRDDLLSRAEIEALAAAVPSKQLLISCRRASQAAETAGLARRLGCALDWADELGPVPEGVAPEIVSFHERAAGEPLARLLERASAAAAAAARGSGREAIAKVSPLVESLADLAVGDRWRRRNPERRAFLPRSRDGRWAWYRLATKGAQPVNFWREGDGSAADQPPLLRWLRARGPRAGGFVAVLGRPVAHSRTPAEQRAFADGHNLDAFAIDISPGEWDAGGLELLREMGLRYAAVTAPLKERAFAACAWVEGVAAQARAANSLAWSESAAGWLGANTDFVGMERAWKEAAGALSSGNVALWGGGGTLAVARKVVPGARAYSARTGAPRDGGGKGSDWRPQAVIWAVGRSRMGEKAGPGVGSEVGAGRNSDGGISDGHDEGSAKWPPADWAPELIFDLNYAEDSPGREYAARSGARYFSGLAMFRAQAEAQRAFWRSVAMPPR